MTDTLRVILELGKKRRIVAAAMDWPGLDRWGTSEDGTLDKLLSYAPRYAGVAERAGIGSQFAQARDVEVAERVPGSSSTDFWGIAHVPSQIERDVLSPADLEPRLDLLRACWAYANEPGQFSRKIEVRTPPDVVLTPDGLATHRRDYLDAIRAYNADGKPARTWPIQFLIRRTAHHVTVQRHAL